MAARIILFFLLLWSAFSYGSDTIKKMKLQRDTVTKGFDRASGKEFSYLSELEELFQGVLKQQLSFCSQDIEKLNEYFLGEDGINENYDITSIRVSCLKDIRKWHLNTEKKFYKYKRLFLKRNLQESIGKLNAMEDEEIKSIISSYKKLQL